MYCSTERQLQQATSDLYTISAVATDAGNYSVRVTGSCGTPAFSRSYAYEAAQ
jgi:hypothetical protein